MTAIKYLSGYKYQLVEDYLVTIPICPVRAIKEDFIELDPAGILRVKAGYAWDGPSGPTIDTKDFMRGSLVHDALYQLMRDGLLDESTYKDVADNILRSLCIEDGMSHIRAWWVYQGVQKFGTSAATEKRIPQTAP